MKRVLILAEGQTEEKFVKEVLAPHLAVFGKWPEVTCVCTKRILGRRAHRGGLGSYDQVKRDIRRLLQSNPDIVSTFFDYYALPDSFPGYAESLQKTTCFEQVECIESAMARDIADQRFIPNLVVHEFEALLFSKPEIIAEVLIEPSLLPQFREISGAFASPEEINDSFETAPSRRIAGLCPRYQKPLHGPSIALRIGIEAIREKCKHFDRWLQRLEA